MKTWKTQLAGAVLIAVMAIALGIEAGHLPRKTSSTVPLATTTFPIAHHTCAQTDAAIGNTGTIQAADGTISACLRVGSVPAGTYRIAARRNKPGGSILGSPGPSGDWLTLTPPSGPPGTHIKISGYVANLTTGQRGFDRAQLCWESCDTLVGSVQIDWSAAKPGQFTADLDAPAAPWFSGTTVAPLRPGRYKVTFPCLPSFDKPGGSCSGVRLEAHFDLLGQGSSRCTGSLPCAVLQSTPATGPPGTVLAVDGWAPLTALSGNGFVAVAFEGEPTGKPGFETFTPLIASTPFTVTGAPGWASLPPLHPVFIQRTGMDAIGADPANPRRFAYCGNGVIKMTTTGGTSWSSIPLAACEPRRRRPLTRSQAPYQGGQWSAVAFSLTQGSPRPSMRFLRQPRGLALRPFTSSPTSRATRAGPGRRCRCRPNPRWAGLADFAGLHRASRRCSGRKRPQIRASPRNSWSSRRRMVAEAGRQPACGARSADRASASDPRTTVVAWPSENGRRSKSPAMAGGRGLRPAGPAG